MLRYLAPFALAGIVVFAAFVAVDLLAVPLSDATFWSSTAAVEVPLVPGPVTPGTVTTDALWGLKPLPLVAIVSLWSAGALAVALAAGVVWWWRDPTTPLSARRFAWLGCYAVVWAWLVVFVRDLLPVRDPVTWLGLAGLAAVAARSFVAPVVIVREGHTPFDAVRRSNELTASRDRTLRAGATVLALALGGHIATGALVLDCGLLGLALATVPGTTVVAAAHAHIAASVYEAWVGEEREGESSAATADPEITGSD